MATDQLLHWSRELLAKADLSFSAEMTASSTKRGGRSTESSGRAIAIFSALVLTERIVRLRGRSMKSSTPVGEIRFDDGSL